MSPLSAGITGLLIITVGMWAFLDPRTTLEGNRRLVRFLSGGRVDPGPGSADTVRLLALVIILPMGGALLAYFVLDALF